MVLFTVALQVSGPLLGAEIYDDSGVISSLCVVVVHRHLRRL